MDIKPLSALWSDAVVAPQNTQGRHDIYAGIHKALRMFMFDTLPRVGSADSADAECLKDTLAQLRSLLAFCAGHLQHENEFVHAAMEARRPGSTAEIAGDHVHHLQELAQLRSLSDAVEHAAPADSARAMARLYRELTLFVAHNLTHMDIEETRHNAVLWETHTDQELAGIEQAIVASLPAEESALSMRWMIPAMSHAERVATLSGAQAHAPAEVFKGLLGIARANLSAREWSALAAALSVPDRLAA